MEKRPYFSLIIPAYNEAKRLPNTLVEIKRHLEKVDFSYEVIIVDNASTDHTKDVIGRFEHLWPELRMIDCKIKGKGVAVKSGMLDAKGEYRAFTDADNSISIDQITDALKHFSDGEFGVIIGSRDVKGAKHDQPWYRRIAGNIGNIIIQVLVLPGLWDTQCPMKIFKAEAAEKIFPLIKVKHWGFDVEILALAKKFGYKIKEIPAVFINDPNSKVKITTYLEVLWEVCKIRYWLWTNKYK